MGETGANAIYKTAEFINGVHGGIIPTRKLDMVW